MAKCMGSNSLKGEGCAERTTGVYDANNEHLNSEGWLGYPAFSVCMWVIWGAGCGPEVDHVRWESIPNSHTVPRAQKSMDHTRNCKYFI